MQWKEVANTLLAETLRDGPYECSGRILFLEHGTEYSHSYGNQNYTYHKWVNRGYLFELEDGVTWMTSSSVPAALTHVPCGTYWLPDDHFQERPHMHAFMRTGGSLKQFREAVTNIISRGISAKERFRLKPVKVEL